MKWVKRILRYFFWSLLLPLSYVVVSLLLTSIPVNTKLPTSERNQSIYLSSNGIHVDIVLPTAALDSLLKKDLNINPTDRYLAFGWGDEIFYLETPTWSDLTLTNAFRALFLKSAALMHCTRYQHPQKQWIPVKINASELAKLNAFILASFAQDEQAAKTLIPDSSYYGYDAFYKATGNYSCFNTCNTWTNDALKTSGLKACFWTSFAFGILGKYE